MYGILTKGITCLESLAIRNSRREDRAKHHWGTIIGVAVLATFGAVGWHEAPAQAVEEQKHEAQLRPAKQRVSVPVDKIRVDDGDTAVIEWPGGDHETVRILGIDTPETQHLPHDIPFDQPFGREALGFARGAFAVADRVELIRSESLDPYQRSLGYFYLNGRNYSALIVAVGLAAETVSFYGDNGLHEQAADVTQAAKEAGPAPFEPPHQYRKRMREITKHMKETGSYPE